MRFEGSASIWRAKEGPGLKLNRIGSKMISRVTFQDNSGLGFEIWGLGLILEPKFEVSGLGSEVLGLGVDILGLGFAFQT